MLHLFGSFCMVCFKTLFLANFLTLSRFWSKLAWSDSTKTSISQKLPTDFDQILSLDVKLMKDKVHQILCRYLHWFWSYSGKTRRGARGAGWTLCGIWDHNGLCSWSYMFGMFIKTAHIITWWAAFVIASKKKGEEESSSVIFRVCQRSDHQR